MPTASTGLHRHRASGSPNAPKARYNPYDTPTSTKEGSTMPVRSSEAVWEGSLREGAGRVKLGSGAFEGPYSFVSRFEFAQCFVQARKPTR